MRSPGRSAGVLALALTAMAGSLRAQTLNPVVTVLPRATSTVPQDCEQGLTAAPAPRVTPEEKKAAVVPAPPTVPVAPPSASLRDVMRDLQDAAERGDREAFRTLFARAKTMVANYPPGAEKSAASDALKVYEDIEAFLDYQYDVPTGAFFDASTDGLLARMRSYPDYQRAIADQTIVDANGTRFYPTRETRAFLVREAASRLRGVRASTPVAPQPPKVAAAPKAATPKVPTAPKTVTKPTPKTAPKTTPKTTHTAPTHTATKRTPSTVTKKTAKTTTSTTTPKTTTLKPAPTAKVAKPAVPKATTKREPVRIAESHTPPKVTEKPAPRKTEPVPPPPPPKPSAPPAATQTAAPPPPAPVAPATQTQTAATDTTGTTTTSTTTVATTAPTATASTESTTTEGTTPSTKGSRRNLILPLILIVIGVGVLILLFRTSS